MGKLKPVGSEKLQGIDKIKRIIEISTYNLNKPQSINEVSSNEYKKTLADGNTYHIVKEKTGYVIKKGLNESTAEYIEPIKNRKFYPSYSQALKRLNFITKEINLNENQTRNISLFTEGDDKLEYVLDLEEQTPAPAPQPAPQPAPAQPAPAPEPTPEDSMGDADLDLGEPMPEPEEPMDMEGEDDDEVVTFKTVQKATGKLAQKIRTFLADEENEMSSEDTKYVINSVLSALDLSTLDEDDLEEIMAKFEGEEGEEMPTDMGDEMPDMGDEMPDMGGEEMTPPPAAPEGGEMAEYRKHGSRKNRHQSIKDVFEEVFSESKVDKVLGKYFNQGSNKKSINNTITKIQTISESFKQEVESVNFIKEHNDFKLLGKTKKGYLVFENQYERVRVSPKGNVI